ncbi:unnamed protein product, partial [Symbiodinium microadriaticum]
ADMDKFDKFFDQGGNCCACKTKGWGWNGWSGECADEWGPTKHCGQDCQHPPSGYKCERRGSQC